MSECFVVRWLCRGAWAWLPGDWPVGLLSAVYHQAVVQQAAGRLTWLAERGFDAFEALFAALEARIAAERDAQEDK